MTLGPLQTKWVEALESGKYLQGTGQLRNGKRYCCLGLLLEHVLGVKPVKPVWLEGYYRYDNETSFLNKQHLSLIGLSVHGMTCFTDMNDIKKFSFPQIACAIKADPGKFFEEAK